MRFLFKTSYDQDIALIQHNGQRFWYGLLALALLTAPLWSAEYLLSQMVFIAIYGIVGLGLMLLTGYTGQVSLGHAAFMGVGAYTHTLLVTAGWPFLLAIAAAAALSAAVGVVVGLPALRVRGIYLAIATMAFGFIVEEIAARWESVTGGNSGLQVPAPVIAGFRFDSTAALYYLCLAFAVAATFAVLNLLRSATGRAFIAIRDSEISAQSMGISLARYKTVAFAISAFMTGVAGALYAHQIRFITPEQFTILQSIELLLMIVIGGLGSIHGAFFGAAFIIVLPQFVSWFKDFLPAALANATGLKPVIFGLVMILVVLLEPYGIYGRWLKIRTYFQLFPLYRRGMFRRQKSFQKTERLK
ncbi:MAG: branched-chain amino acid ABC transporter permease [Sutterellaceae bacterium]|nr:branched-chain amino acid ABC transporter permease [Burkholderiaceae bacterium]MDW8429784.1 branched-chain amino acid ABC transporter permease [Sutterellaceae bacterium]